MRTKIVNTYVKAPFDHGKPGRIFNLEVFLLRTKKGGKFVRVIITETYWQRQVLELVNKKLSDTYFELEEINISDAIAYGFLELERYANERNV